MHFIVAGCGRVGSQLALFLSYEGHDVVVIDSDADSFSRLGSSFNGVTLEGMAFDEEALNEAGIERAYAFASVTNHDNTNLMAAEVALNVYGVPKVIARLYDPDKEFTYRKMGVDYVCGTALLAERMRDKILQKDILIQHELQDLGMRIIELTIPTAADGEPAGRLNDGRDSRLLVLVRKNRRMDWRDDTPLARLDRAVVAVTNQGLDRVWNFLAEEPLLGGSKARRRSG